MKPFNDLSAAEAERLALLLEELGEAQQAIGKILRHGYESCSPYDEAGLSNRTKLEIELGDVQAAIKLMVKAVDIDRVNIKDHKLRKLSCVQQWLHCQGNQ